MAKKAKEMKLDSVKTKNEETITEQPNNVPQMPEVRAVPRWAPDASISVTGVEWEALQNSIANFQTAMQAIQAVMSRNIVEGTIILDYEKLNPASLQYEQMTDEEKEPYVENAKKTIEALKAQKV